MKNLPIPHPAPASRPACQAAARLALLSTAFLVVSAARPAACAADTTAPVAGADVVFAERDGLLVVEAEHFYRQTLDTKRAWHIISSKSEPAIGPDGDPAHLAGASGGAYVELLPDTRRTHDDKLVNGENFSSQPGKMAVLHYKVRVATPGRYYVWARAHSTGSEDNGIHIGLDGKWPESGQRWQTVAKNKWHWECRQRTEQVHTGVPMELYLDIEKAGDHELMVGMREDGFELDKLVLAMPKDHRPEGQGAAVQGAAGKLPAPFPAVAAVAAAATPAETPKKAAGPPLVEPRRPDGGGKIDIGGELKQWHKVTLTLDGPFAHERDNAPNPFTDLAFNVTFTHESGSPKHTVPGYFAADGDAANTSAASGTQWRAHLSPDKPGRWTCTVSFRKGAHAALDGGGEALKPFDGATAGFEVAPSDKTGRDFRAKGRLQYVGRHHLQFAGSKEYFLKAGPDAPETLLACTDFDDTETGKKNVPLKTWEPHVRDWKTGDPAWKEGKGKGLIGALNYLAGKGVNAFSFLTYNAGGDGDNVWPFVERDNKLHYDCSRLDQWGIVFDHATALGLYLHFKLQENEMDDDRRGSDSKAGRVPESLDGGKLGPERKLYCRELIARFGHALALNWNIGEENTQSTAEIRDMAGYLRDTDPYDHLVVVHTFPPQQDKVYTPLLGDAASLTGVSLQNPWNQVHQRTLQWLAASAKADHPWVVANDEQNPAGLGVPPDIGYKGHDGIAIEKNKKSGDAAVGDVKSAAYTMHDIRKLTLWGNLMAGGAGVEYYFGYQLPENDLVCEDFRSRDRSWDYCRIALEFFQANGIPFWEMANADPLVGNAKNDNSKFCLAKPRDIYLVYLPRGGSTEIDLAGVKGDFTVRWFNPRAGGALAAGSADSVKGGAKVSLGTPPADPEEDWLAIVRRP